MKTKREPISFHTCAQCGKEFYIPDLTTWVYRLNYDQNGHRHYYCSYTCYRQAQQEKQKKKEQKKLKKLLEKD